MSTNLVEETCKILAGMARRHPYRLNLLLASGLEYSELVHSDIIAALLDPTLSGGNERLVRFLAEAECPAPALRMEATVQREKHHIDILVKYRSAAGSRVALIVENKIGAADQDKQIQRYVEEMTRQGFSLEQIEVCYLTKLGGSPSSRSVGSYIGRVRSISYSQLIQRWLLSCEGIAKDESQRHTIRTYREAVQSMSQREEDLRRASSIVFDLQTVSPSQVEIIMDAVHRNCHYRFLRVLQRELTERGLEPDVQESLEEARYEDEYGIYFNLPTRKPSAMLSYGIGFEWDRSKYRLATGLLPGKNHNIDPSLRTKLMAVCKRASYDIEPESPNSPTWYLWRYDDDFSRAETRDATPEQWEVWATEWADTFLADFKTLSAIASEARTND